MFDDNDEDDQTKEPRTRGNRQQKQPAAAGGDAGGAQPQQRMMPWDRQGGWGQQPAAPNGNTGIVPPAQGGQRPMPWGGGFQPGGIMGGQGQGQGMPNWQALAQQFAQRFQNNPFLQRLGMTGQGWAPPGQAPAAPPPGAAQPPVMGAPGAQPGAAPRFAPQIQRLAQLFGRQGNPQPGGIVGPGQGPQQY